MRLKSCASEEKRRIAASLLLHQTPALPPNDLKRFIETLLDPFEVSKVSALIETLECNARELIWSLRGFGIRLSKDESNESVHVAENRLEAIAFPECLLGECADFSRGLGTAIEQRQSSLPQALRLLARALLACTFLAAVAPAATAQTQTLPPAFSPTRIELLPLDHSLKLAEPNRIPLRLHGTPRSITLNWQMYDLADNRVTTRDVDFADVNLLYNTDGSTYVLFTPPLLRKLHLFVSVAFDDMGTTTNGEDVDVIVPSRKPYALTVGLGPVGDGSSNLNRISMDMSQSMHQLGIQPWVAYAGFPRFIRLRGKDVAFKITTPPGQPVPFQFDPTTGIATSKSYGEALLQITFQGLTTFTCIRVVPDASSGGPADCHELLPPGASFPPIHHITPPAEPDAPGVH